MFQSQDILQEKYQLNKTLGRTAPGHQTWLAINLETQEQVTIKLLAFSPQMQWEEFKLFEREAQVLEALKHSRIPRYRDYFSIDKNFGGGVNWFALVQDYIDGFSLQELLEQGKHFSEKQVRFIATEILNILIYLHELSPPVLHRDIKPSNLILGKDKHIYLIDFGAVQAQAAVTGVTFTVVGTSGYAPLEQFWGRAIPASDLYALGATLIHLLTGTPPSELPQKDSRIQFSDRVSLKGDLINWLEKITDIAIEKRFSTAQQALEILKTGKINKSSVSLQTFINRVPKPLKTAIELNKSAQVLDILLPKPRWRKFSQGQLGVLGILFWLYFGLGGFIGLFSVALVLIFSSVPEAFLGVFILLFLGVCCYLFGIEQTYIVGDYNYLHIKRKWFKYIYKNQSELIQNIQGIFIQQYGRYFDINLRTQQKSIKLHSCLSEEECLWLVQELQDWINTKPLA